MSPAYGFSDQIDLTIVLNNGITATFDKVDMKATMDKVDSNASPEWEDRWSTAGDDISEPSQSWPLESSPRMRRNHIEATIDKVDMEATMDKVDSNASSKWEDRWSTAGDDMSEPSQSWLLGSSPRMRRNHHQRMRASGQPSDECLHFCQFYWDRFMAQRR